MARSPSSADTTAKAHSVFIRLVLPPYTIHFKSSHYMKEPTLELLDKKVCKSTLRSSASDPAVRISIGTDPRFWAELGVLLKAAIPSLERRSFTIWDPSSVDYESTSGALIAANYPGLWKDLERLNDLVSISRNCLTAGAKVQDLAAQYSLDAEVFRLINCCVRMTARGYDGDAGTGDEERWQLIVNAYKKLLITCLQFLNNLVAQNERRKLMLWVSLFDHSTEAVFAPEDVPETSSASLTDVPSNPTSKPAAPLNRVDFLLAYGQDDRADKKVNTDDAEILSGDARPEEWPEEVVEARKKLDGKEEFYGNGYAMWVRRIATTVSEAFRQEKRRDPTLAELHLAMPSRWAALTEEDHEYWQGMFEDALAKYRQNLAVYEAKMLAVTEQQPVLRSDVPVMQQTKQVERKIAMLEEQLAERYRSEKADVRLIDPVHYGRDGHLTFDNKSLQSRPVVADDMRMLFTAEAGAKILGSGKAELMKRLEGYEAPPPPHSDLGRQTSRSEDGVISRIPTTEGTAYSSHERGRSMTQSPPPPNNTPMPETQRSASHDPTAEAFEESAGEEEEEEEEEDESEEEAEEEEDEEDYPGSTEDGRGLLTDVPLILGPSEIEVLPMLIMSGIVPPAHLPSSLTTEERNALMNMHTVRTHLLLSQSNGRNLLRELLIFVAAWDLREEELYFKFMVKIMEAILKNGLMPYAYHAFRDRSRSKDIISPAQAVIMKLLTCIFRARGEAAKAQNNANPQSKAAAPPHPHPIAEIATTGQIPGNRPLGNIPNLPSRVDLHILNFIFTEFRQHIIPQTCALIFLQGQIHAGRASPEDFPLNLWDMERMYEGVYQYLEFFAVLTEESVWKGILGQWEMASELVTLLRELEGGIPKMGSVVRDMPSRVEPKMPQRAMSADAAVVPGPSNPPPIAPAPSQFPVAVERPFDMEPRNPDVRLPPLPPVHPTNSSSKQPLYEAETPLAYPTDEHHGQQSVAPLASRDLQHDQDEPSDFEWRNLKKLTVLVLSSLIWKNKTVQDQVRNYGGLEALVGCCRPDDHNPYIREHAIMCLRFAVEGSEENAKVIKDMANAKAAQLPPHHQQQLQRGRILSEGNTSSVPREVLDTQGYETFMDPKGQVGLRRKDVGGSGQHKNPPRLSSTKLTAERAAELMNSALSSLPLGDKMGMGMAIDKEKLAKLDRAFDQTSGGGPSGGGTRGGRKNHGS